MLTVKFIHKGIIRKSRSKPTYPIFVSKHTEKDVFLRRRKLPTQTKKRERNHARVDYKQSSQGINAGLCKMLVTRKHGIP